MASLFEQYEQATQRSATATTSLRNQTSVTRIVDNAEPIFKKRRVPLRPSSPVTSAVVSNGQLVLAMASRLVMRLDLTRPEETEEIDFAKYIEQRAKLGDMFIDFTGNHLLVSVVTSDDKTPIDVLYLNRKSKKPKLSSKMKSHNIGAVAWDCRTATETCSGPILIATKRGVIFETSLTFSEDKYHSVSNVESYWKQLFDLNKDGPTSITGLEYHIVSETENKCFVLVTTPSRLYQFVKQIPSNTDPPVLLNVFNNYADLATRFQEIPSQLSYSQLQFYYPSSWSLPKSFAWMTGVGVLHGGLDYSGNAGPDTLTTDVKLIAYPKDDVASNQNGESTERDPLSVVLTEFHILIMYNDRVKALCVLNEEVIMEDVYTETYGNLVCLVKDPVKGTMWAFSEYAVYKYAVIKENRNVWQVYLNRGDYNLAKQYCKDDPESVDAVYSKQAHDYFLNNRYDESADLYAMSRTSFEEVTLKFLELNKKNALKIYLQKKLSGFKSQDKIQVTMIVTWLVELYLNQLGEWRDVHRESTEDSIQLRDEFYCFLEGPKVKECVSYNRHVIYSLLASHGDHKSTVHFAGLIQDYERMIQFHIQNADYIKALEVLQKYNKVEFFYQFCPVLMQHIPKETIDACIALGGRLNPSRMIPTLVIYNKDSSQPEVSQTNEAVRYLEFCVRTLDCKDQTIHNYLMSLYAKSFPDRLLTYLQSQGQNYSSVCYDLEYALRVCSECGHRAACVHIYSTMGHYEEAVDFALKFDVDLAKRCADKPEENEELRKKLWLKIAHHVVKEENDIQKAMEFLQECDLIKIEDILPFFPNFVTIDHFKDAICQSLQEYNQHIEGLKEDMEEATLSTEEIRSEIQMFRSKYMSVRSQDKCSTCSYPVLTRSFYLFPCHHTFHTECLIAEIFPQLVSSKRNRVEEIQKLLASFGGREEVVQMSGAFASQPANLPTLSSREQIKMELDDIVSTECPYCGEFMIKNIDEPFISASEIQDVLNSWE